MTHALNRLAIIVKKSSIQGYGVFADQPIQAGDIIEECYTLSLGENDKTLNNYTFEGKNKSLFPLGFGAIYNHSSHPNATYIYDEERSALIISATQSIKKGEEIYINYGSNWFGSRSLTFKEPSKSYKAKQWLQKSLFFIRFSIIVGILFVFIEILQKLTVPKIL